MNNTAKIRKFREMAYARQHGLCYWCDEPMLLNPPHPPNHGFVCTADHIVPVSKGGRDELYNIVAAHRLCNSERGNADEV
jgi:hypothetical protein